MLLTYQHDIGVNLSIVKEKKNTALLTSVNCCPKSVMAIQLKHGEKFQPFTCSSYLWTDGQKGPFHMVPFPQMFQRWWWWRGNPVYIGSTACALDLPVSARWCLSATSYWQYFCVCLWNLCFINELVGQPGATFYVPSHANSLGLSPVQPGPNLGQKAFLRFLHAIPWEAKTGLCPWKTWAYNMHHWILWSST